MLSTVLRSKRAVQVNIEIMRALVGLFSDPFNDLPPRADQKSCPVSVARSEKGGSLLPISRCTDEANARAGKSESIRRPLELPREMAANPEDEKRDNILRFLYERHKKARGIQKIPIGIRDLQSEMKKRHKMSQPDVASNLDYLIQVGWVREVIKDRTFKTQGGMELSREQTKYKISDVGINHLEAGTTFKKPQASSQVNITNIKGVTILGDGNIVNAEFTDLSRALAELDQKVAETNELTDEQKLDVAGDVATIRGQIAKKQPDRSVIRAAWESLKFLADVATIADAAGKVGSLIGSLL